MKDASDLGCKDKKKDYCRSREEKLQLVLSQPEAALSLRPEIRQSEM